MAQHPTSRKNAICLWRRCSQHEKISGKSKQIISVSVFKVISITVSVSFFTRSFLYVYSISIENLFSISFSMSFTDINHFSIILSFSYWNITGRDPTAQNFPLSIQLVHNWFCSYLNNRQQYTRVADTDSFVTSVSCGFHRVPFSDLYYFLYMSTISAMLYLVHLLNFLLTTQIYLSLVILYILLRGRHLILFIH